MNSSSDQELGHSYHSLHNLAELTCYPKMANKEVNLLQELLSVQVSHSNAIMISGCKSYCYGEVSVETYPIQNVLVAFAHNLGALRSCEA